MLQDVDKTIDGQMSNWVAQEVAKRHSMQSYTKDQIEGTMKAEGYRIEQDGLKFTLFQNDTKIAEFKPSLNFSQGN